MTLVSNYPYTNSHKNTFNLLGWCGLDWEWLTSIGTVWVHKGKRFTGLSHKTNWWYTGLGTQIWNHVQYWNHPFGCSTNQLMSLGPIKLNTCFTIFCRISKIYTEHKVTETIPGLFLITPKLFLLCKQIYESESTCFPATNKHVYKHVTSANVLFILFVLIIRV